MVVKRAVEFGAMGEWNNLARFAGVEVAEIVQLPDVLVAFSDNGRLGYSEQLIRRLAHGGHNHDGMERSAGFYYACDTLDGDRGFDGTAAEFHYDHVKNLWARMETDKNGFKIKSISANPTGLPSA